MKHPRWWFRSHPYAEGWYFWKRNRNWKPERWRVFYFMPSETTCAGAGDLFWEGDKFSIAPSGGHWSEIRPEAPDMTTEEHKDIGLLVDIAKAVKRGYDDEIRKAYEAAVEGGVVE